MLREWNANLYKCFWLFGEQRPHYYDYYARFAYSERGVACSKKHWIFSVANNSIPSELAGAPHRPAACTALPPDHTRLVWNRLIAWTRSLLLPRMYILLTFLHLYKPKRRKWIENTQSISCVECFCTCLLVKWTLTNMNDKMADERVKYLKHISWVLFRPFDTTRAGIRWTHAGQLWSRSS